MFPVFNLKKFLFILRNYVKMMNTFREKLGRSIAAHRLGKTYRDTINNK